MFLASVHTAIAKLELGQPVEGISEGLAALPSRRGSYESTEGGLDALPITDAGQYVVQSKKGPARSVACRLSALVKLGCGMQVLPTFGGPTQSVPEIARYLRSTGMSFRQFGQTREPGRKSVHPLGKPASSFNHATALGRQAQGGQPRLQSGVVLTVLLEDDGARHEQARRVDPLCGVELLFDGSEEKIGLAHGAQALLELKRFLAASRGHLECGGQQLSSLLVVPTRGSDLVELEEDDGLSEGLLLVDRRSFATTDDQSQGAVGLLGAVDFATLPRKLREQHEDGRIHPLDLGGLLCLGERDV
jgi:hypothetical protein